MIIDPKRFYSIKEVITKMEVSFPFLLQQSIML